MPRGPPTARLAEQPPPTTDPQGTPRWSRMRTRADVLPRRTPAPEMGAADRGRGPGPEGADPDPSPRPGVTPVPCSRHLRGFGLGLLQGVHQVHVVQHVARGGGQFPQQGVFQILQQVLVLARLLDEVLPLLLQLASLVGHQHAQQLVLQALQRDCEGTRGSSLLCPQTSWPLHPLAGGEPRGGLSRPFGSRSHAPTNITLKPQGGKCQDKVGTLDRKTKTHEHPPDQRACSRTGMTAPGNSRSGFRSLTDFSSEELNSLVPHV